VSTDSSINTYPVKHSPPPVHSPPSFRREHGQTAAEVFTRLGHQGGHVGTGGVDYGHNYFTGVVLSCFTRPPEVHRGGRRGQASRNQSTDGAIFYFAESSFEKSATGVVEGTAVIEVPNENVLHMVSRAVVPEYMAYVFLPPPSFSGTMAMAEEKCKCAHCEGGCSEPAGSHPDRVGWLRNPSVPQ